MKYLFLSALVLLLPCACSTPSDAPDASAGGLPEGAHYGEPMGERSVVTFSVVDAAPKDYFEQTLLVEATVTAVCAKKGCWMQVEDGESTAMVRWESGCGGKYVFPPDAVGKRILIQGSFYPKTISEEDAEHMEEEAGHELEIEREGYEFNASAVLVMG